MNQRVAAKGDCRTKEEPSGQQDVRQVWCRNISSLYYLYGIHLPGAMFNARTSRRSHRCSQPRRIRTPPRAASGLSLPDRGCQLRTTVVTTGVTGQHAPPTPTVGSSRGNTDEHRRPRIGTDRLIRTDTTCIGTTSAQQSPAAVSPRSPCEGARRYPALCSLHRA